jgi:hypothetical protein
MKAAIQDALLLNKVVKDAAVVGLRLLQVGEICRPDRDHRPPRLIGNVVVQHVGTSKPSALIPGGHRKTYSRVWHSFSKTADRVLSEQLTHFDFGYVIYVFGTI